MLSNLQQTVKSTANRPEADLDKLTRAKYPTAAAFAADIVGPALVEIDV